MKNAKTTPKKAVKKAATTSKKTVAASKKSAAKPAKAAKPAAVKKPAVSASTKKPCAKPCSRSAGKCSEKGCAAKVAKKSAARSMDFEKFLEAAFSDSECKKMARAQIIKTAIRLLKADEKAAAKIAAQVDVAFPKIEVAFKG